jgi:hypothetical protein
MPLSESESGRKIGYDCFELVERFVGVPSQSESVECSEPEAGIVEAIVLATMAHLSFSKNLPPNFPRGNRNEPRSFMRAVSCPLICSLNY